MRISIGMQTLERYFSLSLLSDVFAVSFFPLFSNFSLSLVLLHSRRLFLCNLVVCHTSHEQRFLVRCTAIVVFVCRFAKRIIMSASENMLRKEDENRILKVMYLHIKFGEFLIRRKWSSFFFHSLRSHLCLFLVARVNQVFGMYSCLNAIHCVSYIWWRKLMPLFFCPLTLFSVHHFIASLKIYIHT